MSSSKQPRVALYARISTAKEREEQNIDTQLRELRRFAIANNWKVARVYKEFASGAKASRPELDRMMIDAAARRFDYVVVYDLSRLTRGGILKAFEIIERLKDSNVEFWSMTQAHFRTSGRNGSLLLAIAAHIAEEERLLIGERIKSGIARARSKGKRIGNPKRTINMLRLIELKDKGKTLRQIAKLMKIDKMTVSRRLKEIRTKGKARAAAIAAYEDPAQA